MQIGSPYSPEMLQGSERMAAPRKAAAPSPDLSAQERDILAQERSLKASTAGASASTRYIYATSPDGVRYIVGAEVTITGPEEVLDGVPGGEKSAAGLIPKNPGETSDSKRNGALEDSVAELARIQREVIAHEAAHKTTAGRFGGPVHYTYTTGPDGKSYVTGGEVPISAPATSNPAEALRNARQVQRAAMAPGDPSGQDVSVAASAAAIAATAAAELAREDKSGQAPKARQLDAYVKLASQNGLWLASDTVGKNAEESRQSFEIAA